MPPTRRLNIANPTRSASSASSAGTSGIATSVKPRLWNGRQNSGSSVIWFQSMKSGMPGVDWIFVASGVDASSFRYIAMQ